MRPLFKILALVAMSVGFLGGREAKCGDYPAAPGCAQCAGSAYGRGHGHGGHNAPEPSCAAGGDVWCPVYPRWVMYEGARKLSWRQSFNPLAARYRVTELQVFPPLPYGAPHVAPAPAPASAPTTPASEVLAPMM